MPGRPQTDFSQANETDAAITGRFACRAFQPTAVHRATVEDILKVASSTPSGANTQPWNVFVVAGEIRARISEEIGAAHRSGADTWRSEYDYYTDPMPEPYDSRKQSFGKVFYGSLGIEQSDMEARRAQTGRNYDFFGAPVGLFFTIRRELNPGSWLDLGMFIQSVMIAAKARGLDTCPQETFSRYHDILRRHLPIPDEEIVVCGMSLGQADLDRTQDRGVHKRVPPSEFALFSGFDT